MITFLVLKGGIWYDMSRLVISINWSGRKGSASRSVSVELLDSADFGNDRPGIDIEDGQHCIFFWQGKERFRGIMLNQEQSNRKQMPIVAYDVGIYFANNTDTFSYTKKTANDMFIDCCKRFNIPYGEVANTGYRIAEMPKPSTTPYDVVCDALSQTYKATGGRFYPLAMDGKMHLLNRRENVLQWVIETGVNLIGYSYSKSLENVKTRIKLYSSDNKVLASKINTDLETKIGIFQEISTPDSKLNKAQLTDMVKSMLDEKSQVQKRLSIDALGIPEAISGIAVYVIIKEVGIARTFFIDEDSHTFRGRHHTMSLVLNHANIV